VRADLSFPKNPVRLALPTLVVVPLKTNNNLSLPVTERMT
jgi:hypothetical protein